jgi:hypothetical protein
MAIGGSNISVLDYVLVTLDSNSAIDHTPSFSFTTASPVSGSAYIAMLDLSNAGNGWNVILGPGSASGSTLSFAAQRMLPLTLKANGTYVFALLTGSGVATPSPLPTYPGATGSAFSYSGNQTQTDTYTYPSPSPLPSTSATSTLTSQVTVGSSPFPGGTQSTLNFHQVLTNAGPLSSVVTTSDSWYGLVPGAASGSQYFALYGSSSTDNANDAMSIMYTTPNTVDVVPETDGAKWSNSPAGTTNATFADGETLARVENADGSFTETTTDTLSHHYTFVLQDNADGSGSYSGTGFNALGVQSLNVSAPSAGQITVTYLKLPSDTMPNPSPVVIATPAAWFTPMPGPSLYAESNNESTNVAFPAACAVPSQFGFTGTHVAQTIDRIDPMIGSSEHIVNDTYYGIFGPVCMTMSDTLTENYDYLLDTADSFANFADFSGNAKHVQTIAQTLTLQNAALMSTAKKTASLSTVAISAARGQFALNVARTRHTLMSRAIKRIEAKIQNGGLK